MKGMVGELNDMKISIKPGAQSIKKKPYKMNLHYKEQVKQEINKMLDAELFLLPIDESDWISLIVI